jgi:hypothetical protein
MPLEYLTCFTFSRHVFTPSSYFRFPTGRFTSTGFF